MLNFINKTFNSAFKLAPKLRTGNKCSKVKKINFFICETSRNFTLCNFNSKALGNSCFTYTRFTDKARVIFSSSAKDLMINALVSAFMTASSSGS